MSDKMFSSFVSYSGSAGGGAGYTFCTPTTPTQTTVVANSTVSAPAAEGPTPNVFAPEPIYHIEIAVENQHRMYSQAKKDQQELSSQRPPELTPAPPEPPTTTAGPAPAVPSFAVVVPDVSITFVDINQPSTTAKTDKKRVQYPEVVVRRVGGAAGARRRGAVADPSSWAGNVRKLQHQRGEAYVSRRGKLVPPRAVRSVKDCLQSCKLHCSQFLSETDRQHIFKAFYSLNSNEKKHFLLNTTERASTKRPTKMTSLDVPKRKYSFKYFFLVRGVRYNVCKSFYLGTLAISQKPVYNVHEFKSDMNIPKPDGRGRSDASSHALSAECKEGVRRHIMSHPVAGATGRRQYLAAGLSVKKMYRAYGEACARDGRAPVKESMYRKIFSSDFNLHFRKRKSERCDSCNTLLKNK